MNVPPVDVNRIRQLRAALRDIIPGLKSGRADNEAISACSALLMEAVVIRTAQEIKRLRGTDASREEMLQMMGELTECFAGVIREAIIKRVPDAETFGIFLEPEKKP